MSVRRRNQAGTRGLALGALAAALIGVVPAGDAAAAEITYLSVTGSWRDPVDNLPGSQPGDPVIINGTPTSSINWGTTAGSQSGYDFTGTLPPPFTLPGPIPFFSLGSFQHRNFEVSDPSLTSVQLDVELMIAVDGVPTGPLTFTFTFNHEETPNNPPDPPGCPYPTTGTGCTDRVTIVASPNPTTFNVDGVDYTLSMSFLNNGNPVSEFITEEGGTINSSGLVGEFELPPGLTVTKSGPATMNRADWGQFLLDVRNDGVSAAHNARLIDRLPDGPTGGMCDVPPEILSARVYAADGVTPVPGKGPLAAGTDYDLVFDGTSCELRFETLSAASVIGVDERLMIAYRSRLDADTDGGITLTNIAGATAWYSDVASNPARIAYARTLTDGTPGIDDHQDDHSVATGLPPIRFEKTVINMTTGEDPATYANPGDTLRYRLYVENLGNDPIADFQIVDELDSLNTPAGFASGTLNLITLPAGADAANTNATGGAAGTGLLDVRDLALGGLGTTQIVEFEVEVEVAAGVANGMIVRNQSRLLTDGFLVLVSDDPLINGPASAAVDGDEDPTEVPIVAPPYFDIDKISTYLDGDPTRLLAGERLRYTITVANISTADVTDAVLRDQVPVNTTYIAGSTMLNGTPIADLPSGLSPLSTGMPINAAGFPAPGAMPAGPPGNADYTATIVFDVLVDPAVVNGTIISNQAYASSVDGGITDQPSDDPRTPVANDPTRDVVGNAPLIYAEKSAMLETDLMTPGVVDPGDTLRYRIVVYNNGVIPATMATLSDAVPTNTSYVPGSTTLNGIAIVDGGFSPLIAGLPIASSDLTPPVPDMPGGMLSPGESAVVEFLALVDAAVPPGTLIVNQAHVGSYEFPAVPTDGDGNPATGPEPTVVVVGPVQALSITKQVAVIGGGPALPGSMLEYIVRVRNLSTVPATYVRIYDDLDMPVAGQLSFVPGSATMNGLAAGIVIAGSLLTADYSAEYGALEPNAEIVLRFEAEVYAMLPLGTVVTNQADVQWNDPPMTASASVSVTLGGMPGMGMLSGTVWHDADFDDQRSATERVLEGWTVALERGAAVIHMTTTDADGNYRIAGVAPTYLAEDRYQLRFSAPGAGPDTATLGRAFSDDFTNGLQLISDIAVPPGSNLINLNLPIDPNGVVYNTVERVPLAGVRLTMLSAASGTPLSPACFEDEAQQGQVTLGDGYYKFDIDFSEPDCPEGGAYLISALPPSSIFIDGPSAIIPPETDAATAAFSVPSCLVTGSGDAIPATTLFCESAASEFSPPPAVPSGSPQTAYRLHLVLDNSSNPGSRQIFNNHIPLDPDLRDSVSITKVSPALSVSRGDLVPYTITVTNDIGFNLNEVRIVDRFPAGFKYVEGSARIDSVASEPVVAGQELSWDGLALDGAGQHRIDLLLAVGAGVGEGDFVNRAQVLHSVTGFAMSGEATATVRLVPDPDFDCTDVLGKVYDDRNRNGRQDSGEEGIGGVRLVSTTGLAATTDAYGRYHITCAVIPNESRGSNFVLKLDDRTLPSGFRAASAPIRIERATRGKALTMNFGASLHRVVGLDIADPIFEPGETALRPQWESRIVLLLDQLAIGPAVLRLSYLADIEEPGLVDARVAALERRIAAEWQDSGAAYELEIESEIFWRLGGPPERAVIRQREAE